MLSWEAAAGCIGAPPVLCTELESQEWWQLQSRKGSEVVPRRLRGSVVEGGDGSGKAGVGRQAQPAGYVPQALGGDCTRSRK